MRQTDRQTNVHVLRQALFSSCVKFVCYLCIKSNSKVVIHTSHFFELRQMTVSREKKHSIMHRVMWWSHDSHLVEETGDPLLWQLSSELPLVCRGGRDSRCGWVRLGCCWDCSVSSSSWPSAERVMACTSAVTCSWSSTAVKKNTYVTTHTHTHTHTHTQPSYVWWPGTAATGIYNFL